MTNPLGGLEEFLPICASNTEIRCTNTMFASLNWAINPVSDTVSGHPEITIVGSGLTSA